MLLKITGCCCVDTGRSGHWDQGDQDSLRQRLIWASGEQRLARLQPLQQPAAGRGVEDQRVACRSLRRAEEALEVDLVWWADSRWGGGWV